jgi:outer membrane protein OmpA-like peptidoglycan-associated protein
MKERGWIGVLAGLLVLAGALAVRAEEGIHVVTPGVVSQVTVEPSERPQQAVVSVLDPSGDPIEGLGPQDFAMGVGIRKARILAVELLQAPKDTPSKYVLTYELLNPIVIAPKNLGFEVLTTTTGRPAVPMVFFHTDRSEIPEKYIQFKTSAEADAFRPDASTGALERYFNVLNFVGRALRDAPEMRIGIVGCNAGVGPEKDHLALSRRRAEAVRDYLQRIWGIAAARMPIEARNLPEEPSFSETRNGRLENQRVEFIFESDAAQSQGVGRVIAETGNRNLLTIRLDVYPLPGLDDGEVLIQGNDLLLKTLSVGSDGPPDYSIPIDELGRDRLSSLGSIEAVLRITDAAGRVYEAASDLCQIKTRQREVIPEIGHPPYGTVKLEPETVLLEEVVVVEYAPLLNQVYFDTGRSDLPGRYHLFKSRSEAQAFDEKALRDATEKYREVLNIIGKRLVQRPRARLTLIGGYSGSGEEKGRIDLARSRAEAVRAYLRTIWGIDPARLATEARSLPAAAGDSPEIRTENQRIEIQTDDPAILDPVQSTFSEVLSAVAQLRILPEIENGLELKSWSIEIYGDDQRLEEVSGQGALEPSYVLALRDIGMPNIGRYQILTAALAAVDANGRHLKARDSSSVHLVQREERRARGEGYQAFEKYALIQFDPNRAEIKGRNQRLTDRIGKRIGELPQATVRIVGHSDASGDVDADIALSRKRAETVYERLLSLPGASVARDRVSFEGKGPLDAMFDNGLPEGRVLNRNVTVVLEYEQK